MSKISRLGRILPSPVSAIAALVSAFMLALAFPGFGWSYLAWVALIPLLFAVDREKESLPKVFFTGWMFGLVFFFSTCWWLTFAPINYAHLPAPLVYLLLLGATSVVGVFPGLFGTLVGYLLRRFGPVGVFATPFVWIAIEFLRLGLTGNNWNAIGYSQAFIPSIIAPATFGGVYLVGFAVLTLNTYAVFKIFTFRMVRAGIPVGRGELAALFATFFTIFAIFAVGDSGRGGKTTLQPTAQIVVVQPNVPMDGSAYEDFKPLLARHVRLSEEAQQKNPGDLPKVVLFPESPMIFQYGRDPELQEFLRDFAVRNDSAVIFNSAEWPREAKQPLNSAVMVDAKGEKIAQYDKIYLLPFGEFMPLPDIVADALPAFVGNFRAGEEFDLLPFGDAKGGVMICFESHFGSLSREYARRGADVLVEMTNDGYLGNTPVLRQHLASSIFRAVETNRPLVRATNVGVTAYITPDGEVVDAAPVYEEATRVWKVGKSGGDQTFYVRFGDWFAWLCSLVTIVATAAAWFVKRAPETAPEES